MRQRGGTGKSCTNRLLGRQREAILGNGSAHGKAAGVVYKGVNGRQYDATGRHPQKLPQ